MYLLQLFFKMSEKWLNLSIEKDAGYSKLMVLSSALFSTALFGFNGALNLITADWKIDKNLPFETAALHSTFQVMKKYNLVIRCLKTFNL